MGCPSAGGDLGVAVRLRKMVVKISASIQPETHYFKGQPRTGEIVSTAVHREWCVLHKCAAHIAPAAQLHICSDAGCTAVRVDPSGVYTCMEGVISPVQLYGLYGTVCTNVHVVYSKRYSLIAP